MLRFVYFFSDSPNLMKTTQNFLYSSWSGSDIHYMWNDSKYLLFRHIADLYFSDQEFRLHTLPMLTMDHIVLMCYSKMKVKLARKVMRKFVEISRQTSGNEEVLATATCCKMTNDVFDWTNARAQNQVYQEKKSIRQAI